MAEAREVMDQVTKVVLEARDLEGVAKFLAIDVVAVTPDVGQIEGREQLVDWMRQRFDAFPDAQYQSLHKYESGNTAIDVGRYFGTNTGPLTLPTGESIPATGKTGDMRTCELATVEDGLITQYEFYFDQLDLMQKLGLVP